MSDYWTQIDVNVGTAQVTVDYPQAVSEPRASMPLSSHDWSTFWGSAEYPYGKTVNAETALSYSPIWQGVDLITSDISRIPFLTYERVATQWGDGKERARAHPVYNLLRRHTGEMNSNMWLVRMVGHAMLYGDAYSIINRRGNVVESLSWIHSDRVDVRKIDGRKMYVVEPDAENEHSQRNERFERYPENEVFHLEGLAIRQLGGCSIVQYARKMIRRALNAEGFGDDYFENGGPGTLFEHPGVMSPEAQENFLRRFQNRHTGTGNRFRFGVVEEGMKVSEFGISAKDAMLVDFLAFSVKDAARFLNVPPHKLGDDSRTSFNSVEQENRSYFNSSLGKWTSRLEFEANHKLFAPDERQADTHFCEFKTDGLFKADTADRMQAHAVAITNGIKNFNEVRAEENLNPYEGGDEFIRPLNMTQANPGDQVDDDSDDDASRDRFKPVLQDAFERATNRIVLNGKKYGKGEKFPAWVNAIDVKHRPAVRQMLEVSLRALGEDEDAIDNCVSTFMRDCATAFITQVEHAPDYESAADLARQQIETSYRKQITAVCGDHSNGRNTN